MQEHATRSLLLRNERSFSSAPHMEVKEGRESDEETRKVPEFGMETAGLSPSSRETGSVAASDRAKSSASAGQRKRVRSPADKEHKRLKRLLRNRVSAQQARERKKAYLNDLEAKVKDLEKKNSELEERLSTLQNENQMLRQAAVMMTAIGESIGLLVRHLNRESIWKGERKSQCIPRSQLQKFGVSSGQRQA